MKVMERVWVTKHPFYPLNPCSKVLYAPKSARSAKSAFKKSVATRVINGASDGPIRREKKRRANPIRLFRNPTIVTQIAQVAAQKEKRTAPTDRQTQSKSSRTRSMPWAWSRGHRASDRRSG